MDQQLRKQYLHALGIRLWVPKYELPGAKKSCNGNKTVSESIDSGVFNAADNNEHTNDEPILSANAELLTTPTQLIQNDNMHFGVAMYSSQCLVVAQLKANEKQLSTNKLNLLNEILAALNVLGNQYPELSTLVLPCNYFIGMEQSQLLEKLIISLELRQPIKVLLLFGQVPSNVLTQQVSDANSSEQQLVVTLGIQQMLDDPKLKKQVWNELQPLRQWLKGNE